MSRAVLGGEHGLVQRQFPPGELRVERADPLEPLIGSRPGDKRGGGDGARVDHRVARPLSNRVEADLVERLARRLHINPLSDDGQALVGKRESVAERLRNRLDGKTFPAVADLVDGPVAGAQADGERIRVYDCQLRYVVGDSPSAVADKLSVDPVQNVGDERPHRPTVVSINTPGERFRAPALGNQLVIQRGRRVDLMGAARTAKTSVRW